MLFASSNFINLMYLSDSERLAGLSKMPIKKNIATDKSSQAALRTSLGWLAMCENFHKQCQIIPKSMKPPKRLLSIGVIGDEHLKLVEPKKAVDWICLSHRWGGKVPTCLTKRNNYQNQLKEISWNDLPRTFQDAVTFTRRLGHLYLWIDALCIVQDDDDDWRREYSRLPDYYGGSALTLSATSVTDCNSGLFKESPVPFLQFHLSGDLTAVLSIRRKLNHILHLETSKEQIEALPILSRAWFYQERLLSRRILHFSNEELQWECRENTACDCGFTKADEEDLKIEHYQSMMEAIEQGESSSRPLLAKWKHIVHEYSLLQLTNSRDKLPALSGLAKEFEQVLGKFKYQYLAGLWHIDDENTYVNGMLPSMLWAKLHTDPLSKRPVSWRSPTWSWASVDGGISYQWDRRLKRLDAVNFISNLHAQTGPVTGDSTGEIQAAHLSLRGPIVEATVIYPSSPSPSRFSNEFLLHTHVQGGSVESFFVDYALYDKNDIENYIADGDKVTVLRVCHIGKESKVISLVLKEIEAGSGMYRRIGIAEELSQRESNEERNEDGSNWPLHQGTVQYLTIL
jgi:Heterokaryon incompatibility protein (HET)